MFETLEKEKDDTRDAAQVQIDYLRELFEDFKSLDAKQLIDEDQKFRDLRERYGDYFRGGMGAETVRDLLLNLDLQKRPRSCARPLRHPRARSATRRPRG